VPDLTPTDFNQLNKEEIIALLKKIAKSFGRVPTYFEFRRITKAGQRRMKHLFGGYQEFLRQAGFEALGSGYRLTAGQLLADWAAVVRKLGMLPTVTQYMQHGKYSERAFARRWKSWHKLPEAMLKFAARNRLEREWQDVMKIAKKHIMDRKKAVPKSSARNPAPSTSQTALTSRPRKPSSPVYGRPIMTQALATAPTNELGVLFLFAAMATQLGFMALRLQSEFPDCEALRLFEHDRWRRVRIEFEFESRNFLLHGHDPRECDLIVCWTHNWPSCPLEVLELSKLVER